MRAGNVPTARIAPIIEQLIRERWPHGTGYDVLAEKVGCHRDTIEGIVQQHNPGTPFDFADTLLCALGRWDIWHGALGDVYPTRFTEKCALHSCGKVFPESGQGLTRKKYCSKACQNLDWMVKKGERTGDRHSRHGRFRRCGHRMTPDNTFRFGHRSGRVQRTCLTCKRSRQARWAREKRRLTRAA